MVAADKFPVNEDLLDTPEDTNELDFATLLDQYNYEDPYRGQILEGVVLSASGDEVLLDVGLKQDAIVPRRDLAMLSDRVRDRIKPGAEILTYVLQPRNQDGELIVSINKALELEDWQHAQEMMESGGIVEAEVIDTNRGGLLVRFERLTGFVPQSHLVSLPRFRSEDELQEAKRDAIGDKLPLKFIEIDRRRNRLILSERLARAHAQQHRLSELEPGQVVSGKVVSIVNFGAFVDLGGVDGLIHISKLDHRHVNHPGEVVAVGDTVEVRIDEIDIEKNRISLNRVALLSDPWETVAEEYKPGDLVEGRVTNTVDFGIFLELPNSLQGLVHLSKMSSFGTTNPRDLVREGDPLLVRIVNVDPERRRIGLSIDDVTIEEQENWMFERRERGEIGDDEVGIIPRAADAELFDEADLDDAPDAQVADDDSDESDSPDDQISSDVSLGDDSPADESFADELPADDSSGDDSSGDDSLDDEEPAGDDSEGQPDNDPNASQN